MPEAAVEPKVLIIGGSGFLSGTLARGALGRGCQVWTLTRGQRPIPEGVTSLIADRQDKAGFERAVAGTGTSWDLVVDCIAFQPEDIHQDLVVFGPLGGHLVFISTDFVYHPHYRQYPQGEASDHYLAEGYGGEKRLCELELLNASGVLPWTILRPSHIYGPGSGLGCLPEHSRDPELIARMKAGQALRLVGGGYFLQHPILARDLADLILDLQGNENTYGRVFNAAGPEVIEARRYYQVVADILGVELKVEEIPVGPHLAENPAACYFLCHRFYDLGALRSAGVGLPAASLEEGLREHVASLLAEQVDK